MTPTFTSGKIKRMQTQIEDSCANLIEAIDLKVARNEPFDAKVYFGGFTLDVIAACMFGTKVNTAKDPNNEVAKHSHLFFSYDISFEMMMVIAFPWIATNIFGFHIFSRKATAFFADLTKQIVKSRIDDKERFVRNDFVQHLMDAKDDDGQVFTLKKIADNGVLFLFAGYDTSSNALTHMAYLLALNPSVQDKLLAEVDEFFAKNIELNIDTLSELKYLEAVVNETLRLCPPALRIQRVATKDTQLGDTFVPKGCHVWMSTYAIMRSEENFEKPDDFIPERFLPNTDLRHNMQAFLPFATGPRNCIGLRFALFEIKLCFIRVLQRYKFERCAETKVPLEYFTGQLLMSAKEVMVKAVPR